MASWVSDKCTEYEIDEEEVSKLKSQNGKGLDRLSKEDWIRRSENHGDLFFDLWEELKRTTLTVEITDKKEIGRHIRYYCIILYFNYKIISLFQNYSVCIKSNLNWLLCQSYLAFRLSIIV